MEEIKNKIVLVCTISIGCSVITCLLLLGLLVKGSDTLRSLEDDVKTVNYNIRGIDEELRMYRSTERNIENILNDYKKLRIENEILLDKIKFYRDKYEN